MSVPPVSGADEPARARDARAAGTVRPRGPLVRALAVVWMVAFVVITGVLVAARYVDLPADLHRLPSLALAALLAGGLAARCGARALPAMVLTAAVGAAAVATRWEPLLAGAAVSTAVLAACLAVLGTTASARIPGVAREVVLAELLAGAGALGAAGFEVGLDTKRFGYTVLALATAGTIVLVHRLGGGLRGLGRSGVLLGAGALVVLATALAYGEALARYGSTDLVAQIDAARAWIEDHLGAVPHLIEVLVGVPALAWGVSLRARRRQGWWVCALGATATAGVACRLVDPGVTPAEDALSAAYGVVLGLVLGWLLIRAELALTATRGRRTRRSGDAFAHRPEPPRLSPLQ